MTTIVQQLDESFTEVTNTGMLITDSTSKYCIIQLYLGIFISKYFNTKFSMCKL